MINTTDNTNINNIMLRIQGKTIRTPPLLKGKF